MEEKNQKSIASVSCRMTAKENVNSDLLNLHSTTFSSECEIEGELKDLLHCISAIISGLSEKSDLPSPILWLMVLEILKGTSKMEGDDE